MKLILISILTIMSTVSAIHAQEPFVVILNEKSTENIEANQIGSIRYKDKAFKSRCSYQESTEYLKETAIVQGANLVKITRHRKPDGFNKCHRFDATLYKVANPRIYEKEIIWSEKRKLTWEDFKAKKKPPAYTAIALSYCGISYGVKAQTSLYANSTKYEIQCIFYPKKSWITTDSTQLTDDVLKHEQLHFDLCEVYARLMYKELTTTKLNAFNIDGGNAVFQRIYSEYEERQIQYDEEVYAATTDEVQKKWNTDIAKELKELEEYANRE